MTDRFILIQELPDEFPITDTARWYWDIERPQDGQQYAFMAIQCYKDRDPNKYVRCEGMALLYTDQAEYYAVCQNCYWKHHTSQWTGSTNGDQHWREWSRKFLEIHEREKGWCQFCDPAFGNGGWSI